MTVARFSYALVLWLAGAAPLAAGDLRAEIHIEYQGTRDFIHVVDLPASASSDVESDADRTLRPHIDEAKKKLAVKQGYSPAIYGPDYYKMIRVERVRYRVTDTTTSRVVAETRRGSG